MDYGLWTMDLKMNDTIENNYPKAILATGIIMAVFAAICYFIVFTAPPNLENGMGGILVNYGTTDEGMGKDYMSTAEPSVAEKANHSKPNKVTPAPPTEQKAQTETSDKKVVTQNSEDAPVVANSTKKSTAPLATETAKPVVKQTVNQNALYKGKTNSGTGEGDGTGNKPGNQGSANGSTLANNYGPGGSGAGLSLPNWHFVNPPDVKNVNRVPGTVVIDFTIDDKGNVLEAHSNKQKTKAGLDLVQSCVEAIKNSRFTSSQPASGTSKGEMSFIFRVD